MSLISYIVVNISNLEGEGQVLEEWQQVDEVGGDEGEEEHDVGDPQVDVVEEELPQCLAEHRAELQACRVLHHPGDQGLQPADCCLHGRVGRGGEGGRRGRCQEAKQEVPGEGQEEKKVAGC